MTNSVPVIIQERDDQGTWILGCVYPPQQDGTAIYQDDDSASPGLRTKDNKPVNIHDALEELWDEWWESYGEDLPDSDGEFVNWLVEQKGWKEAEVPCIHIFER